MLNKGFSPLPQFSDANSISDQSTKYLGLIKLEGSMVYIVCIANLDRITLGDFDMLSSRFYKSILSTMSGEDMRNIVHVNILSSAYSYPGIREYIDSGEEYLSQNYYLVNYAVSYEEKTDKYIYSSPKQPKNILGIFDSVKNCIFDSDFGNGEKNQPAQSGNVLVPNHDKEYMVYFIFIINAIMMILMSISGGSTNSEVLMNHGAVERVAVLQNNGYYRLLSGMFLHIGYVHFLFNSISMYIFGTRSERYYGSFMFVVIYLVSGLAGNIGMLFFAPDAISAGASGAIFGLIGSILALALVTRKVIGGLNYYVIFMFALVGILIGFFMPDVGNAAHICGFFTGLLIGLITSLVKKFR